MSYTKHTWVNGETITDTLLNHMEDGIANASSGSDMIVNFVVTRNGSEWVVESDTTGNDIIDAFNNDVFITARLKLIWGDDIRLLTSLAFYPNIFEFTYSPEGVVSAFISFDAETNEFNYSES